MKRRDLTACLIGNILEWYEFTLFAYLSPVISEHFFPVSSKINHLLATFFVFAAGFFIRPLGSIIIGHWGDTLGRAQTLKRTVLMMSLPAIMTALIPTYTQVGLLAPLLLIACRLLQGFCLGGEFAGSMIYLAESAKPNKRGFYTAMTNNGSNVGVLLAVFSCTVLSSIMPANEFNAYGWRLLFFISGVLGLIGLKLRGDISESSVFKEHKAKTVDKRKPILQAIQDHRKKMLTVSLLLVVSACGSYTVMNYFSTYMHVFLHIDMQQCYRYQMWLILLSLVLVPPFAILSDMVGRHRILIFATLGYMICAVPLLAAFSKAVHFYYLLPIVVFYSAEQAVVPAIIMEYFPMAGRYSGISLSYNITMAVIGGSAPLVNTWLNHHFNTPLMTAYYLVICASISLFALLFSVKASERSAVPA